MTALTAATKIKVVVGGAIVEDPSASSTIIFSI
jgi:hypothetical protein